MQVHIVPIGKDEFEDGMSLNEVEDLIMRFFKENPNLAFTCEEVWEGLRLKDDCEGLRLYLTHLRKDGMTEVALVKTQLGYKCYHMLSTLGSGIISRRTAR